MWHVIRHVAGAVTLYRAQEFSRTTGCTENRTLRQHAKKKRKVTERELIRHFGIKRPAVG